MGCVNGIICVYDSLFRSVDEPTKRIINNLFLFDPDKAVEKIKLHIHSNKPTAQITELGNSLGN